MYPYVPSFVSSKKGTDSGESSMADDIDEDGVVL